VIKKAEEKAWEAKKKRSPRMRRHASGARGRKEWAQKEAGAARRERGEGGKRRARGKPARGARRGRKETEEERKGAKI